MDREERRQGLHVAATAPALLLAWLNPWAAVVFAAAGVVLGALVLPRLRLGREILRPGESAVSGIQLYPVGVLLVVLAFPLPIAAAGWGALGAGDAASNVVGRRFGRRPLPWNPTRTWIGTLAFVPFAAIAAAGLLAFVWPNGSTSPLGIVWPAAGTAPSLGVVALAATAAAIAGALAESIPRLDDNLSIPVAASLAAWAALVAFA